MRATLAIGAGIVTGALLVRERHRRAAAERFAAATMEALLNAIDANDSQTGAHARRVAAYALVIADALQLDEHQTKVVERVALFHDIGKIHEALFDIIHENSHLTPAERRAVITHPQRGADVLAPLQPFYPDLALGVMAHHERWDGSGYPKGLRGLRIPLSARIVMLADTFDAVTHNRRYRDGRGAEAAAEIIASGRGTQFDPELVDLMLLPPVLDRIVEQERIFSRVPRTTSHERRRGERESDVPDVMFRWRSEPRGQPAPDLTTQRSR
ncbi:MAG TPA: HD domain-containing phosphohydrolase [Gemmatimonadales bacterium]|nr:HD domain-containing phosphohydrolase [Gemmatimonadales bacterium]